MEREIRPPSLIDAKLGWIIVIVVVSIILTLAFMGYTALRALENVELLPEPDPLPHNTVAVSESIANISMEGISPVEVDLLGNATGFQVLVVRGDDGRVTSFVSNDIFSENVTKRTVCRMSNGTVGGELVTLGHLGNGTIAVACQDVQGVRCLTLEDPFGNWTPMDAASVVSDATVAGIGPEDVPFPKNVYEWETAWDSYRMGDREVVVGIYWYQAGCYRNYYNPAVLFREDSGKWSTIVVLDYHRQPGLLQVAGNTLGDMVIITCESGGGHWTVHAIMDGNLEAAGGRPPARGLD